MLRLVLVSLSLYCLLVGTSADPSADLYQPAQVEIERFKRLQEQLHLQEIAKQRLEQMHQQRQRQLMNKLPPGLVSGGALAGLDLMGEARMPTFYHQAPVLLDGVNRIPAPLQVTLEKQQNQQAKLQTLAVQHQQQQQNIQPQPPSKVTMDHFKTPTQQLNNNFGLLLSSQGSSSQLGSKKVDNVGEVEHHLQKFMDDPSQGKYA